MLMYCFDKREFIAHVVTLHYLLLKITMRKRFFRHEWCWFVNVVQRRLFKNYDDSIFHSIENRFFFRRFEEFQFNEKRKYMFNRKWNKINIKFDQFRFQINMNEFLKYIWNRISRTSQFQKFINDMFVSLIVRKLYLLLLFIRKRIWFKKRIRQKSKMFSIVENKKQEHDAKNSKCNL